MINHEIILEYLKSSGKITDEDIRQIIQILPSKEEVDIIDNIHSCYCVLDDPNYLDLNSGIKNLWIKHFIPILRQESSILQSKISSINDLD